MLKKGVDVKVSEVHGMSQRGGSVVTYVRFGDKVYSPIIDKGEADYIISFETLEAARYMANLKPSGQVIVNNQQMDPMPVITGAATYPEGLIDKMKDAGAKVDAIDALGLAMEAGSAKAANVVLMGRFSTYFTDVTEAEWLEALEECVPPKFIELNKKAFDLGRKA
jgi:indolepyruvate ferredoxin oxidoreductase beta subunit